jgi:hypothetical protein
MFSRENVPKRQKGRKTERQRDRERQKTKDIIKDTNTF